MKPELRTAVALLFDPPSAASAPCTTMALNDILVLNRAPLAAMRDDHAGLLRQGPFKELLRQHHAKKDVVGSAYRPIAERWMGEDIIPVLIKSPGYFPYTSDNVDVLVPVDRADRAVGILSELDYVEITPLREPHKRYFRSVGGDHPGFAVHLHVQVAWINTFIEGLEVIAASRQHPADPWLWYPSPDHVALITTAHWFYEDKHIALRDLFHMAEAIRDGVDWKATERTSDQHGWLEGWREALEVTRSVAKALGLERALDLVTPLDQADVVGKHAKHIDPGTISLPYRVPRVRSKLLHVKKALADPHSTPAQRTKEIAAITGYALLVKSPVRIRRMPKVVVAISGVDGSGKTTEASSLVSILHAAQVPVQYHWTRAGSSRILDLLRRLVRKVLARQPRQERMSADQEWVSGRPISRRVWASILGIDYLTRLWSRYLKCWWVGGVHVFDRYAIDAAADLSNMYRVRGDPLIHMAPKPDLSVLLRVDTEIAYNRSLTPASPAMAHGFGDEYERHADSFDVILDTSTPRKLEEPLIRELISLLEKSTK